MLSVGREGEDDGESAELGRSRGSAVFMKLDLGSLASVRECAEKICETEEKIDILVNNAGRKKSKIRKCVRCRLYITSIFRKTCQMHAVSCAAWIRMKSMRQNRSCVRCK